MNKFFVLALAFSLSFLFINTSCQKPTDCKATVHCVDSTGAPLRKANVLLYAKPGGHTADVMAEGTTDEEGKVTFTFKLPAIFDIKATSGINSAPITGSGLIRLEEGKGSEKTITLK